MRMKHQRKLLNRKYEFHQPSSIYMFRAEKIGQKRARKSSSESSSSSDSSEDENQNKVVAVKEEVQTPVKQPPKKVCEEALKNFAVYYCNLEKATKFAISTCAHRRG